MFDRRPLARTEPKPTDDAAAAAEGSDCPSSPEPSPARSALKRPPRKAPVQAEGAAGKTSR